MSRSLRYPESVRTFASHKAETFEIEAHRVALHGRSFGGRRVPDDFVGSYPARREGWLNIGVLHTALDGTRGHASYAPCTVADLRAFGYDYWALGHVHAGEIVSEDPWIVYPGNLQGRSVREVGPKGAMRVTVEDGRIVAVTPLVLDAARWAHEDLDVAACADEAAVLDVVHAALQLLHPQAEGRPLAVRFTLTGTTPAHAHLVARRETIEEEARALGFRFAEDCWVEQVKLATTAPARPAAITGEPDALDVNSLLAAAAADPEFAGVLAELTASVADKLPRELRSEMMSDDADEIARLAALARDYLSGALAP
jgi:exonuclease SbcD